MAEDSDHYPFQVYETTVVKYGQHLWVPDVKDVNGIRFIGLSKWNREFIRFVSGRGLDLRNTQMNTVNSEFFDTMLAARKAASVEVIQNVLNESSEADDADPSPSARKPKSKQKHAWAVVCASESLGPPVVDIHVQGHQMKVLLELRSNMVWVELTPENLQFIQAGIIQSPAGRSYKRKASQAVGSSVPDASDETNE